MNPERWKAVGDLFDAALLVEPEKRSAWLDHVAAEDATVRAEVASLLASHEAAQGRFVQNSIKDAVLAFDRLSSAAPIADTRVGPYRLIRELGAGGMGVVCLAVREDEQYTAQVAIKLIRPGMDGAFLVARFRKERQTLARLQHPNIARLLDGGTTEAGLPYLVMEYIEGQSLTEYLRDVDPPLRKRIELLLPVCDAVDYAHRNFIVHRDIKPGNILVNEHGSPKLLDFGICKLLKDDQPGDAKTQALMITPDYGSPEQVWGEAVTLQSDVYSLGVVLYEALTGVMPHGARTGSVLESRRVLTEKNVVLPSLACKDQATSRELRGDIDIILLRALERDPLRRYQTVAQLADDLSRYLRNEPILARRASRVYRARKFVLRHRTLVAAGLVVLLSLGTGLGVSIRQTRVANRRLHEVQTLAGKLIFDIHDAIQDMPGSTQARGLVVKAALNALDHVRQSAEDDPAQQVNLAFAYRRLGDVQGDVFGSNLGDLSAAEKSYGEGLKLVDAALRAEPQSEIAQAERVNLYTRLAKLHYTRGDRAGGGALAERGLKTGEAFLSKGNAAFKSALADLYVEAAEIQRTQGEYKRSLEYASASLRLNQDVEASGPRSAELSRSLASAYASVGMAEASLERLSDARAHYLKGIAEMERLVAEQPGSVSGRRDLMLAYGHLADVSGNPSLHNLGDRSAALAGYQRAAEIARELHTADPADHRAITDYAIVLSRLESVMEVKDVDARAAIQLQSLQVLRDAAKMSPESSVLRVYQALELQHIGNSWLVRHDASSAAASYRSAVEVAGPLRAHGDLSALGIYIASYERLAESEILLGHREEALLCAKQALLAMPGASRTVAQRLILPRTYAAMGRTYAKLAASDLRVTSDVQEAREWLQKSLDAWQSVAREPSFGNPHREEMAKVSEALKKLNPA